MKNTPRNDTIDSVLKLKSTTLHQLPQIAVTITDQEHNAAIQSLRIDVLEIRVDLFRRLDPDYVQKIVREKRKTGIPLILTVRNSKSEGGRKKISDSLKLKIFTECVPLVDALDIELRSPLCREIILLAKRNKKSNIISFHDFKKTPPDSLLENLFKKAKAAGADVVKIAAQARSTEDVHRLLLFTLKHRHDDIITMSLGRLGSISRLVFPSAGSLLTYSYIGKPAAPGQIALPQLREHLRFYYSQ